MKKRGKAVDELVSVGELAEFLAGEGRPALTRVAIGQFVQDGMPKSSRGLYPIKACSRWYLARLRAAVQQRAVEAPDGNVISMTEAHRRLVLAKAENEEMTARERRGDLMPLSLHVAEVARLIVVTKQRLLNLPARLAPTLVDLSRNEVRALLQVAIKGALHEIAEGGSQNAVSRVRAKATQARR